jgi:hypothetical protein
MSDEDDSTVGFAAFRGFVFRSAMRDRFDAQEIIDGLYLGSYDAARCDYREFESRYVFNQFKTCLFI